VKEARVEREVWQKSAGFASSLLFIWIIQDFKMMLSVLFRLQSESRASHPISIIVINLFTNDSPISNDTVISAIDNATNESTYVSQYEGMYFLTVNVNNQYKLRFLFSKLVRTFLCVVKPIRAQLVDFKQLNVQSLVILKTPPFSVGLFCVFKAFYFLRKGEKENPFT